MGKGIRVFEVLVITLLIAQNSYGQVDNYQKNAKTYDDEQERFERELRKNKDSAEVYWKHGNAVASFTFNARREAWKHYEKALSIDSSRVAYFIDYGTYLHEMSNFKDARLIYERALRLFPMNETLLKDAEIVEKNIAIIEENKKISNYGSAPTSGHPKATDYSKVIDFENLIKETKNAQSPFYYDILLKNFNADTELSDEQMYMLLIGFTQQENFQPYARRAEEVYNLNDEGKFDEAINKANELLKNNPLLPSLYKELIWAYRKKNNYEAANTYLKKLHNILNAMLYTGDGTCERPYVAFWVQEEYTLLKYLNYKKTGNVSVSNCAGQMADIIEVTNLDTKENSTICFNTELIFKNVMGK